MRALLRAASSTNRIAATWFNYCLHWDTTLRAETVSILDANGVLLNSQNVSNFHNGQYLMWQLSGHVQIRVNNTAGANAVISGLFFQ